MSKSIFILTEQFDDDWQIIGVFRELPTLYQLQKLNLGISDEDMEELRNTLSVIPTDKSWLYYEIHKKEVICD